LSRIALALLANSAERPFIFDSIIGMTVLSISLRLRKRKY
jgi:hypothetical protein